MLDENNCDDRLIYNDWFGLFPSHIRTALIDKATEHRAAAGEAIFRKGESGSSLAALLSGRVRISVSAPDGREMLISMVERGEICGERAVFDGNPRAGDAIAETDTSYLSFERNDLMPALYAAPEAMMYIIRIMCVRSVRYLNTMELYALQPLSVRLANFLLFLGEKYGRQEDTFIVIPHITQADLSRQIASSRESINRQIKTFATQGLLNIDGKEIVITDKAGLETLCQAPQA